MPNFVLSLHITGLPNIRINKTNNLLVMRIGTCYASLVWITQKKKWFARSRVIMAFLLYSLSLSFWTTQQQQKNISLNLFAKIFFKKKLVLQTESSLSIAGSTLSNKPFQHLITGMMLFICYILFFCLLET